MHKFCVNWAKQKSDMFSWGVCMQSRECVSDLTVPVVLRRTEAARLWVTPTKLVPSTSTIRSFTRILQTQTEYSARVKMNRVFVHQSPQDNKRTTPPPRSHSLCFFLQCHCAIISVLFVLFHLVLFYCWFYFFILIYYLCPICGRIQRLISVLHSEAPPPPSPPW